MHVRSTLLLLTALVALGSRPGERDAPQPAVPEQDGKPWEVFADVAPTPHGPRALVPGYMDGPGGEFRPWRNFIVHRGDIPSLQKAARRDPIFPSPREFAPAVDPPLRMLRHEVGGNEYYLFGVRMNPWGTEPIFFAFFPLRMSGATWRGLPERDQLPPLVEDTRIEVIWIHTPPQYVEKARQIARFAVRDAAIRITEIPIGPEIHLRTGPYVLRLEPERVEDEE